MHLVKSKELNLTVCAKCIFLLAVFIFVFEFVSELKITLSKHPRGGEPGISSWNGGVLMASFSHDKSTFV